MKQRIGGLLVIGAVIAGLTIGPRTDAASPPAPPTPQAQIELGRIPLIL